MDKFETVFEVILAFVALTLLNRLIFSDSLPLALGYSGAILASFWSGRMAVRLFRRRLVRRVADD